MPAHMISYQTLFLVITFMTLAVWLGVIAGFCAGTVLPLLGMTKLKRRRFFSRFLKRKIGYCTSFGLGVLATVFLIVTFDPKVVYAVQHHYVEWSFLNLWPYPKWE